MNQKYRNGIIILFLALISLPLISLPFIDSGSAQSENRTFAPFPKPPRDLKTFREWPDAFTSYFNDHFGFRSVFIRISHEFFFRFLHASMSNNVLVGKTDWLFFTGDNSLNDYRNADPLSSEELLQWKQFLEESQKKAASIGAKFYFLVSPNSSTIYGSDFMPDWVNRISGESRLDQLLSFLDDQRNLVIDVRPVLLENKGKDLLYLRTDTHWNSRGAFIAYQALMNRLKVDFPDIKPLSINQFSIQETNTPGGDLARMLGLPDVMREEKNPIFSPLESPMLRFGYNMIVYRDSFYDALQPFLALQFEHLSDVKSRQLDWTKIEAAKPKIVLFELVERHLKPAPKREL